MEYYTLSMNEIISFSGKWVELEIIMLDKRNQTLKKRKKRHEHEWGTTGDKREKNVDEEGEFD
jgi:hypothetical protein